MTKRTKALPGTVIAMVIGQSKTDLSDRGVSELKTTRSFPTYASHLPKFKVLKEQRRTIAGHDVTLTAKAVPPENIIVEGRYTVANLLAGDVLSVKDQVQQAAEEWLVTLGAEENLKEEYALYCVSDYQGDPRQFHADGVTLVPLMKSEVVELSRTEVEKTMIESSLQYAKDDLTIVDWDGAFIFDIHGDWQDTIDVLEIANVNLLRLRRLDQLLDQRLDAMVKFLNRLPRISNREVRSMMTELMRLRTRSVAEFEHAERDIQLIGDWYAGRLYALISRKLHLDRWRDSIRQVLKSLEEMSSAAANHFSITGERRAEQVQQVLWYLQLVGWFALLYMEWRISG